jgi:hypothetical protein
MIFLIFNCDKCDKVFMLGNHQRLILDDKRLHVDGSKAMKHCCLGPRDALTCKLINFSTLSSKGQYYIYENKHFIVLYMESLRLYTVGSKIRVAN